MAIRRTLAAWIELAARYYSHAMGDEDSQRESCAICPETTDEDLCVMAAGDVEAADGALTYYGALGHLRHLRDTAPRRRCILAPLWGDDECDGCGRCKDLRS